MPYDTKQPTREMYQALQDAYDTFNRDLFDNELPQAMIVLHRKRNANGYFWSEMWQAVTDDQKLDEIALTPETLKRGDKDVLSTLVHEMVHLWQAHFGKPSRAAYHNQQWADKMIECGLMPYSITNPQKQTGQKCSHHIIPDRAFDRVATAFIAEHKLVNFFGLSVTPKSSKKNKVVYQCECAKVWGKSGLTIVCSDCETTFTEG